VSIEALPGGEIIAQGLTDLRAGVESPQAYLVSMAATRLRDLGFDLPKEVFSDPELKLYQALVRQHGDGAHSKYNALRRRLLSFLRTARCAGW
jgi:hypothetical protein